MSKPKGRVKMFDDAVVHELSNKVYRLRLGDTELASMMTKKTEQEIDTLARSYDALTRAYLTALKE